MKSIHNENVIVIFPMNRTRTGLVGSTMEVAKHAHVHQSDGKCFKNRYAQRCSE